jgi:hypothetical protein
MWSMIFWITILSGYLHSIYRIRFFLIYFFNLRPLEQRGFFFSHFNLIKIYKNLKINVYYYDGQGENFYSDFLFDFGMAVKFDIKNNDPETKIWEGFFEPFKILIIFKLMYFFKMLNWTRLMKKIFMNSFYKNI